MIVPNLFSALILAAVIQGGIVGLGDESFETRQACQKVVEDMGVFAETALREAARKSDDLETQMRAGKALKKLYEKRLKKRVSDGRIPSVLTLPDRHRKIRDWLYAEAVRNGSTDPGKDAMANLCGRAASHLIWDYYDLCTGDKEADPPTNIYGMALPGPPWWSPGPLEPDEDDWADLIKDIHRR